jgi:hypothetical protein
MNLQFYKGNAKVTGTACSFQTKDTSLFVNFIKQHSWNEAKKLGSFRENAKNPEKTTVLKFNAVEAAGIVDAINRNAEYKFYHTAPNSNAMGKFCPYLRDNNQIGFSFNASKEQKGDSVNKVSFLIGFTFAEAVLVKEFLLEFIKNSFYSQDKAASAPKETQEEEAPKKPAYNKIQLNQAAAQTEAESQAEELVF